MSNKSAKQLEALAPMATCISLRVLPDGRREVRLHRHPALCAIYRDTTMARAIEAAFFVECPDAWADGVEEDPEEWESRIAPGQGIAAT